MGDIPAGPAGFTRYLMKSKFGAGRDFAVLDPDTEAQLFFVDGKLGPRPKAEVQAGDGSVIYSVQGQLLGIPKKMSITDASGTEVASLKSKKFSHGQGQDDDGDGQRRALAAHRPVHREELHRDQRGP